MRDAGDVKHRVLVFERVEAGVIAERAFAAQLAQFHVAFEHDLGIGRHFQIAGLALHHLDGAAAQEAGDHHLVEVRRQRQNRRDTWWPDRRRSPPRRPCASLAPGAHAGGSAPRPACASASACRWCARRRPACDTAAVALAGVGILREHHRQRDEAAAVLRPAVQDRDSRAARSRSRRITSLHGPPETDLRKERAHLGQLRQHFELADQALRAAHFAGTRRCAPRRRRPSPLRAPVSMRRMLANALISTGTFESLAASRTAAPDRRVFTVRSANSVISRMRVDFERNALQLALLLERANELAQIGIGHELPASIIMKTSLMSSLKS